MTPRHGRTIDEPRRAYQAGTSIAEPLALLYLALPTVLFLAGWVVAPYGPLAAVLVVAAVSSIALRGMHRMALKPGPLLLIVLLVATIWTIIGGSGHIFYANKDWVVRDAVLLDLVRDPWPVTYRIDGVPLLLRAPIGYFLPAALVGKCTSVAIASKALLIWTIAGVVLTFLLMLRDRPDLRGALVRIVIFVAFSGMDILGEIGHNGIPPLGKHIEWWDFLFQYSSHTTLLFWVPNHALPGWLAIAWLLGQDPKRLSVTTAILFVVFTPLWSPLTAIGLAPIVAVALLHRFVGEPVGAIARALIDWRMLIPVVACLVLVFPFLIAGSDRVASGGGASIRWVGEDFTPRYIEFVLLEFAGIAALLVVRAPRDPLLWTAIVVLLLLPFYRFGPNNDLVMRGSIAPLALLAIGMGRWLSTPRIARVQPRRVIVASLLLGLGAVTPLMEVDRAITEPAWPIDTRSSVIDVTRGAHYVTSPDQPWLRRFLAPVER
jgi:hypothetical protein